MMRYHRHRPHRRRIRISPLDIAKVVKWLITGMVSGLQGATVYHGSYTVLADLGAPGEFFAYFITACSIALQLMFVAWLDARWEVLDLRHRLRRIQRMQEKNLTAN